MKISVIIPTYNEGKYIGGCLNSLSKQVFSGFEVIVVDDGSTDMTRDVISKLKIKNPPAGRAGYKLKIIKQDHKGAGAARNLGAKSAKGDILIFVDADMIFEKHFITKLVKPILSGKAKGTFSKDEYVSNWENRWARCWNINEGWEARKRHPKNYPIKQKVFRAILKKEFDRVGGFTPGGYTDDYSLYEKLGYMAIEAKKAIFYHKNPASLKEVFDQAKWAAKRKYKFGRFGLVVALIRSSIIVSLAVGLIKAILNLNPSFFVFKVVYDLGSFLGILDYALSKNGAK